MNELYSVEFWQQCPTPAAAAAVTAAAPYLPLDAALAAFSHQNNNHSNNGNGNGNSSGEAQQQSLIQQQQQMFPEMKHFASPGNVIVGTGPAGTAGAVTGGAGFPNLHQIHNTFFGHNFGAPFAPGALHSLGIGAAAAPPQPPRATGDRQPHLPPPPLPYPSPLNIFNHHNPSQQQQQQPHGHHRQQQQHSHHSHHHEQAQQQGLLESSLSSLMAPPATAGFGSMSAADLLDLSHQGGRHQPQHAVAATSTSAATAAAAAAVAAAAAAASTGADPAAKSAADPAENRKRAIHNNNNNNGCFLWANSNDNNDIPVGSHISADSLKPITIPFMNCQKSEAENGTLLSPHNNNNFHTNNNNSNGKPLEAGPGPGGGTSPQTCQACMCAQSNGLHFGAKTCAACAAFFRRSVSDHKIYQCKRSQRCVIKPGDTNGYRKMCRACRMQRCLEIGMQVANVQNKRQHRPNSDGGVDGGPIGMPGSIRQHSAIHLNHHHHQQEQQQQQQQQLQQQHMSYSPISQQQQQQQYRVDGAGGVLDSIFARINPISQPPVAASSALNLAPPPPAAAIFSSLPFPTVQHNNDGNDINGNNSLANMMTSGGGGAMELFHHPGVVTGAGCAPFDALFGQHCIMDMDDAAKLTQQHQQQQTEPQQRRQQQQQTLSYHNESEGTEGAATVTTVENSVRHGSVIISPSHFQTTFLHSTDNKSSNNNSADCISNPVNNNNNNNNDNNNALEATFQPHEKVAADYGGVSGTSGSAEPGSEREESSATGCSPRLAANADLAGHKASVIQNGNAIAGASFYSTVATTVATTMETTSAASTATAHWQLPLATSMLMGGVGDNCAPQPMTSPAWLVPNASHQIAIENN